MKRLFVLLVALLPAAVSADYLGEYADDETVYVPFTTYGSNNESITITGLAVTDIEVYKDGSMTQRASDSGYTLLDTDGIDLDSTTGWHGFSIDLSDNTTAGFYDAPGSTFTIVLNAITVDSQTVVKSWTFRMVADDYNDVKDGTTEVMTSRQAGNPLKTTIDGVTDQDTISLTTGPSNDDALNDMTIYFVGGTEECQRTITDYTGTGAGVQLDSACDNLTLATSDDAYVFNGSGEMLRTLQADSDLNTGSDGVIVSTGGITAASIATGAIGADELASTAFRGIAHLDTTIATLASQVSFTLTAGSADDDAYNGCMIMVTDQATATQVAFAGIQDYTGSTKTVTLDADPGIFTMATSDIATISCYGVSTEFMNKSEVLGDGSSGDKWRGN